MKRDTTNLDSQFFSALRDVLNDNYSLRSLGAAIGVDSHTASDRKRDPRMWHFCEIAALADQDPQVREIASARFAQRGGTKEIDAPKAAHELIEGAGNVIAELMRSLSDGSFTDVEKRKVLTRLLKHRDALERMIKTLDRDLRNGATRG